MGAHRAEHMGAPRPGRAPQGRRGRPSGMACGGKAVGALSRSLGLARRGGRRSGMLRREQVGGRRGEVRAQDHAETARQLHLVLGVGLGLGLG